MYRAELALLNAACARRLLALCQANGGVYIKAAQLVTTAQAAPAEYRRSCSPANPTSPFCALNMQVVLHL